MQNNAPASEPRGLIDNLQPAVDLLEQRFHEAVAYLPLIAVAVVILIVFTWLGRWISGWKLPIYRLTDHPFAQDLIRRAISAVIFLLGLVLALDVLDAIAVAGAVVGTAGVVGLAVGFAFKDLVENYLASVLLSIRQPFAPNDSVVIDGREGKIVRLTGRATILMTFDGNHLRIPNAQVYKGVILNYSRNPKRRFEFQVSLPLDSDLAEAQRLGIAEMEASEGVLDDPAPSSWIDDVVDGRAVVRLLGWVNQREHDLTKVKSAVIRRVLAAYDDEGYHSPATQLDVAMREPGAEGAPSASAKEPAQRSKRASADRRLAEDGDLSVDDSIDRQIAEDLVDDSETNLLKEIPESPNEG